MSSESDAGDAQPCPPCRGTGQLISTLGGEPKSVPCPWCEGTGHLIPEHDAQARWRSGSASDST